MLPSGTTSARCRPSVTTATLLLLSSCERRCSCLTSAVHATRCGMVAGSERGLHSGCRQRSTGNAART
jgi:hypothetical protein